MEPPQQRKAEEELSRLYLEMVNIKDLFSFCKQQGISLAEFANATLSLKTIINNKPFLLAKRYNYEIAKRIVDESIKASIEPPESAINTIKHFIAEEEAQGETSKESDFCNVIFYDCVVRIANPYSTKFQGNDIIGLKLWPAEFALREALCGWGREIEGRTIVELGCGVGLAGLFCAKHLKAKQVVLTDGNVNVIESLKQTIELYYEKESVVARVLNWKDGLEVSENDADLYIAADVAYDPLDVPDFVLLLFHLLGKEKKAIVAITKRNEQTFSIFKAELNKRNTHKRLVKEETIRFGRAYPHMLDRVSDAPIHLFAIS